MARHFRCKNLPVVSRLAVGAITALLVFGPAIEVQAQVPNAPTILSIESSGGSIESSGGEIRVSVAGYDPYRPSFPSSLKVQWKSGGQDYDSSRQSVIQVVRFGAWPIIPLTGLAYGTEYTVRVIATNRYGNSHPSSERTATPVRDLVAEADATLESLGFAYDYDLEACGGPFGVCGNPRGRFSTDRTTHSLEVRPTTESVTIVATPARPRATLELDPADADESASHHQVSLAEGETVITVTVTSQNGSETSTHTITVTRPPNTEPTGLPTISGAARVNARF